MNARSGKKRWFSTALLGLCLMSGGNAWSERGGPWSGVIGYWRANANVEDLSGNLTSLETAPIPLVAGVQGKAFHFDGSTSLDTAFDPVINPAHVTIGFWVRPTAFTEECCQGLVSTDNFLIETTGGNSLHFVAVAGLDPVAASTSGAYGPYGSSPPILAVDAWTHVAATYDGYGLQLYVNGLPWGNKVPLSGSLSSNASPGFLSIGSEDGRLIYCEFSCPGQRRFTGDMDEIVVLSYAMGPEEIEVMYRQGVLPSIGH